MVNFGQGGVIDLFAHDSEIPLRMIWRVTVIHHTLVTLEEVIPEVEVTLAPQHGLFILTSRHSYVHHGVVSWPAHRTIEIPRMFDKRRASRFQCQTRVRASKQRYGRRAHARQLSRIRMHGWVRADDDAVAAGPRLPLHPARSTKERVGPTVARVDGIRAFDVVPVARFEERHEERLDGLPTIHATLGAALEATDILKRQFATSKKATERRRSHRDGVLVVAHERDVSLASASRIAPVTRVKGV